MFGARRFRLPISRTVFFVMSPPRPPTSYRQNGKTRNRTFARTRGPTSKFSWPIGGPLGGLGESSQTGHPEKSSNKTSFGISKLSSRSTRNTNARQSTLSESVAKMEAPKLKSTIASQQQVDETESKPGPSHPESSPSSMSSMETRIPKKGRAAEGPRKSNTKVIDLCEDRPEESPTRNRTDDDELSFRGSDEDERKSGNMVMDFLNKMSSTPFSASSSQGTLSSRTQSTQSTFRESNRESDGVGTTAGSNTAKSLKLSKVNQRKKPQRARQTLKSPPQQKPKSQSNGFLQTWAEKTSSFFAAACTTKKETPPPSSDPGRWGDASRAPSPRMKRTRAKGKRIIPGATLQDIPSGISESEPRKSESPGSQAPQSEIRRSSRLSKKTKTTQEVETIEIFDTDDEDDKVNANSCRECDLARISYGHKIQRVECKLMYFSSTMMFELSLKVPGRTRSAEARTKQLHFKFPDDLYDAGYFLSSNAGGENTTPLADIENLLCFTPQVKLREWLENVFGVIVPLTNQLPCVVCEFRCREDLEDVVADLRDIDYPEPLFFTKIDASTLPQYAEVLIEDSRNEREKRSHKSPRKSAPSKKFSGKDEEDELLIYPFECNPMDLSTASKGLNEISIPAALIQNSSDEALSARGHFLTIRVGDYLRLEPMEYLNDTLIDLWMSWISQGDKSNTHFFSTHFYTALASKGQSVQRWTEKKNLNVFEKKFIFIPVNRSLHWSLAVGKFL